MPDQFLCFLVSILLSGIDHHLEVTNVLGMAQNTQVLPFPRRELSRSIVLEKLCHFGSSHFGSSHFGSSPDSWLKVALLPRVHLFAVFSLFCIHVSRPWDAEDGSLSMHQRVGCRSFVVPVHLLFDGHVWGSSSSRVPSKIRNQFRSALPRIR